MTFLEYVLRRYIGPPQMGGRYWKCPHCDRHNASVVVNEPRPGTRERAKCRCMQAGCPSHREYARSRGAWDEYDLLRLYHPGLRFPELRVIADELRREYEAGAHGDSPDHAQTTTPTSPPMGQQDRERRRLVEVAWADLLKVLAEERVDDVEAYEYLRALYEAGHFREFGWFLPNVLSYWREFIEWVERTNADHMARCGESRCEWYCCRACRGLPPLPPLTPEELAERRRQRAEEEAAEREYFEWIRRQVEESKPRAPARKKAKPRRKPRR